MNREIHSNPSERGSAAVKLLLVLIVLVLLANAGYNFIPVAYQGQAVRQEMQTYVAQSMTATGRDTPRKHVMRRLNRARIDNTIPPEANIKVTQENHIIKAHVNYTKTVDLLPFGIYQYDYVFDHTASSRGF